MKDRILQTKIQVPPLPPSTVKRSRLFDTLELGLQPHFRLTLLSAPAGYGKTTLLNSWIRTQDIPTAWYTLESSDNDPIRFTHYFLAALKAPRPDLDTFDSVRDGYSEAEIQKDILVPLINNLKRSPRQLVIVLDDYHFIHNPRIQDLVAFLIENLPPQAHPTIATRADPPLPIALLRGRAQLNELRMQDLRFSPEEAKTFLGIFKEIRLQPKDICILTDRTEGWISGLQMAAASLKGKEDPAHFLEDFSGSHRHIMDYLLDEVLSRQPPTHQNFLLHTSLLTRMCGDLCDSVLRRVDGSSKPSGTILRELDRANLFIVPLDEQRIWYRYHQLFADLLQARLESLHPDRLAPLHRCASEWFSEHGLMDEAVQHAIQTEDIDFAADLIERSSQDALMRSETNTFLRWIQHVPEEELERRPKLLIYRAWALLLQGAPLSTVKAHYQLGEEMQGPPGSAQSLRAYIALSQGEIERGMAFAREALEALPEEEIYLRDFALLCVVAGHTAAGDYEQGVRLLEETSVTMQASGNKMGAVMILSELAGIRQRQLRVSEAESLYRQALNLARDAHGALLPIAGRALIGLGDLALERYDLEQAEQWLVQGNQITEQWSLINTLDGHLSLALLRDAQGDPQTVRAELAILQDLARRFDASEFDDIVVDILQADWELRQGNLEYARQWIQRHDLQEAPERTPTAQRENPLMFRIYKYKLPILARLRFEEGDYPAARQTLMKLLELARKAGRPYLEIQAQILLARIYQALGEEESSLSSLQRALEIARPEGLIRIFVAEGDRFLNLLAKLKPRLQPANLQHFATQILQKSGKFPSKPAPPLQDLPEPLTSREIEVLGLLPSDLTAEEMAEALYISVHTVRSHLKQIYAKLAVHSRHEAILRATELNLFN